MPRHQLNPNEIAVVAVVCSDVFCSRRCRCKFLWTSIDSRGYYEATAKDRDK